MLSIKIRCKDTAFFWIMQEKMHFSYDFLIRSKRFSYKILYISTRFSDFCVISWVIVLVVSV